MYAQLLETEAHALHPALRCGTSYSGAVAAGADAVGCIVGDFVTAFAHTVASTTRPTVAGPDAQYDPAIPPMVKSTLCVPVVKVAPWMGEVMDRGPMGDTDTALTAVCQLPVVVSCNPPPAAW
mmetsp:Transcript_47329/g.93099  ORF Transcript_47329/g.93099 Transcript_47329/m.93099 type:complete len:123 (-) Transcript_47329:812-1180(-)